MNKLDVKTRSLIIRLLVEGNSIRATSRIADVSKNTVNKLLIDAGKACSKYHDENVRNVKASVIQCDEIWSFTYAKQKNVKTAKAAPEHAGDTWTWTALDSESKLIVSYMVGGRDSEYAIGFMDDLCARLAKPGATHYGRSQGVFGSRRGRVRRGRRLCPAYQAVWRTHGTEGPRTQVFAL